MRHKIDTHTLNFADPAGDARWPILKVPTGAGSWTVVSARAVSDTALDATDANGRQVLLQNGGSDATGTTEIGSIGATISGVDGTGVDAVWTLTVDATGGNFIIGDGTETHTAAYNITAGDLQTELRTWASMGTNGVTVTGGPGDDGGTTPYVITLDTHISDVDLDVVLTAVDDSGGTPLSGGASTADMVATTAGVAPSVLEDWVAATPKAMTLSSTAGACVLDEGEWLVVKYDETGTDTFKNLTVTVDVLRGLK